MLSSSESVTKGTRPSGRRLQSLTHQTAHEGVYAPLSCSLSSLHSSEQALIYI